MIRKVIYSFDFTADEIKLFLSIIMPISKYNQV